MGKEGRRSFVIKRRSRIPYLKMLQWAIVLTIFFFLGKMIWENWAQIKDTYFTFKPVLLVISTILFAFSYFIQIWAWYLITSRLKIALPFKETLESWFYSQLGKYLPGKVWLLVGRFYFYESKGMSRKKISVALYLETVTLLVAAGLLFLVTLLFFKEADSIHRGMRFWWLLPLFPVVFLSLHPWILQRILNWILIHFKKEPLSLSISYVDVLWILLICVMAWMVGGVGFYLFMDSVFPISSHHLLFLTGALACSSTLGLIAFFAPSGLGVREGALVYLLSLIMPAATAVILSILTRLWMTLIEIGLIGVIYLFNQFRKGGKKKNQHV